MTLCWAGLCRKPSTHYAFAPTLSSFPEIAYREMPHVTTVYSTFLFQCPIQRTAIQPDLAAGQWYLCPWVAQVMALLLPLPLVPLLPALQVLTREAMPRERLLQPRQTPVRGPARPGGR